MKTIASQSFNNLSRVLTYFVLFHRMHFNNLSRVLKCFVFLECLSLKCFRHSVQAQDWGETKLGFFNINTDPNNRSISLAQLRLDCTHIHDGCYHSKSQECIDVMYDKVRDEVKCFDFRWIICFNNFQKYQTFIYL